jgi:hypothetical protein
MCTYNGARYLGEQLASIAAQNRLPDGMVVVDDASVDETVSIVERFAQEALFPVQVEVNTQNLGYAKNFERAIQLAEGDLIALSDQDDVWAREKLRVLEAAFQSSPGTGFVFSDAEVVNAELRPVGYRLWEAMRFPAEKQQQVHDGRAFELLLKRNVVTGATMAFRGVWKDLVLPIDSSAVHDAWIALLISAVAEQVGLVPDPLIEYRQHAASQIGIRRGTRWAQVLTARRMGMTVPGELARVRSVLRRLQEHGGVTAERMELLQRTVDHLAVRSSLPNRRLLRIPPICREIVSGRYGQCANGLPSAVRDMIV